MIQILEFDKDTSIGYVESLLPKYKYKLFTKEHIQDIDFHQPLILLGSLHSVTENTPWVKEALELTQKALENNTPILGICFGSQLVAKCLGQEIYKIPTPEYGWFEVSKNLHVFHWHNEGYKLPKGASALFDDDTSLHCNAYTYKNVIAVQFHFEVTSPQINCWIDESQDLDIDKDKILSDTDKYLARQEILAQNIVKSWLEMAAVYEE